MFKKSIITNYPSFAAFLIILIATYISNFPVTIQLEAANVNERHQQEAAVQSKTEALKR